MSHVLQLERKGPAGWDAIATVTLADDPARGIATPTRTHYRLDYAIEHLGRRDGAALSAALPVGLDPILRPRWPAFLVDLLPQGHARAELLSVLGLPQDAGAAADWALLNAGAGQPIGHLRVDAAASWLAAHAPGQPRRGFTPAEVVARGDDLVEFLAAFGLSIAGSSGVQGEWPKLLMTRARDGLLYLDHQVEDADAVGHFLVKFGRGLDPQLAAILRHEAPYLRLAATLGLRVHADLAWHDRVLWVPRFDRVVGTGGVERIAQESLASLCGVAEFGAAPSHNAAVAALAAVVSDPAGEIVEYLRRDVVNVVLGNRDNHARNTAIQRFDDGRIRLAPVYDLAPMMLHPDGLSRRMRWQQDDAGAPRWDSVLRQCRDATGLALEPLVAALRRLGTVMTALPARAIEEGVDPSLVRRLAPTIESNARQLESL